MDSFDYLSKLKSIEVPSIWLLLQILAEDSSTSITPSTTPQYFIINTDDIVAGDTTSTHAEGFVRFMYKGKVTEGKVIYSAGTKEGVEKKLQQLTRPMLIKVDTKLKPKYFIVQYSKGAKDLIQSVVPQKNVAWPIGIQPNQREVLVFDGHQKRLATVLCIHDDKEYIDLEFQKLKQFCFEKGIDENDQSTSIEDDDWILVLYTCGAGNVVYTILNNNATYWREGNRYPDVIAYLTDGSNVYQAIIVRKTSNFKELVDQLNTVKNCCLTVDFPLEVDIQRANAVPSAKFQSLCGSIKEFEKYSQSAKYAEMNPELNRLENVMRNEAAWIIEFLEVLENAQRVLEQRQAIINDSVDIV